MTALGLVFTLASLHVQLRIYMAHKSGRAEDRRTNRSETETYASQ